MTWHDSPSLLASVDDSYDNACDSDLIVTYSGFKKWQYGMVRSDFAYYVPRTLNRTSPAYRTSVQFLLPFKFSFNI